MKGIVIVNKNVYSGAWKLMLQKIFEKPYLQSVILNVNKLLN